MNITKIKEQAKKEKKKQLNINSEEAIKIQQREIQAEKPPKEKVKENNNLDLWDKVCETDPRTTKEVSTRGGFTSICAQVQIKNATEMWGTYGDKWGVENLVWGTQFEKEITLEAIFYYPGGSFSISSDIVWVSNGDSRKKLLTDLTTKALSKLGFNSDVFEGRFEDQKYVKQMQEKFKPIADKNLFLNKEFAKILQPILKSYQSLRQGSSYKKILESFGFKKEIDVTKAKEDEVYKTLRDTYIKLQKELIANKINDAPDKNSYNLVMTDFVNEFGDIEKITDAKILGSIIKSLIAKFPKKGK